MAKSIMIQGTMSNAGKSILAGALCRIIKQDGYKVAPFKSQNMALNSYVTRDGLEMGRAQVMQAEAAGIEPSVYMNPILLKPTNNTGSQVIVNGKSIGNMSAREYFQKKTEFIPDIMAAYNRLSNENDYIVIEGAGSPAEINLKKNDIVNMGMARLAGAPVILVGDIDRGGVFAQLLGTIEWLEREERSFVKGLVINKFRGDVSLLYSGIDMLYERVKIDTLGVVPYIKADIDDEDSLSDRLDRVRTDANIDIAVIRLPWISNFTDFNIFQCKEKVSLRYVSSVSELGEPDMIILPGTKNTIEDLKWLKASGLYSMILRHADEGKAVFGICGGYQILGRHVKDPLGMEAGGSTEGLGLLQIDTIFDSEKTLKQVSGRLGKVSGIFKGLSGCEYKGYEIHMGLSGSDSANSEIISSGNVYGSYIHGLFDEKGIADEIISSLRRQKGIEDVNEAGFSYADYKNKQYDILAREVRNALDMDKIYEIMDKGI